MFLDSIIDELNNIRHILRDVREVSEDSYGIKSVKLHDMCVKMQKCGLDDIDTRLCKLVTSISNSGSYKVESAKEKANKANAEFQAIRKQFNFPDALNESSNQVFRDAVNDEKLDLDSNGRLISTNPISINNKLFIHNALKTEMKKYGFVDIDDKNGNDTDPIVDDDSIEDSDIMNVDVEKKEIQKNHKQQKSTSHRINRKAKKNATKSTK